jgi:hypothetical protein
MGANIYLCHGSLYKKHCKSIFYKMPVFNDELLQKKTF